MNQPKEIPPLRIVPVVREAFGYTSRHDYQIEGWDELDGHCRANLVLWSCCDRDAKYYDMTELDRLRWIAAKYVVEHQRVALELADLRMRQLPGPFSI